MMTWRKCKTCGRMNKLCECNKPALPPVRVEAVVGQGYRVNSEEWWTFDTEKYAFFHEQCCDCGLNHKTHVRLDGTKIHFRHERRDRPPTPDEIDNSDLPNALPQRTAAPAGTLEANVRPEVDQ